MAVNQRKRILVVDDDPAVRDVVIDMLQLGGYKTESAIDGQDALAKLRQYAVDLVLSDVDMLPMNGFALLDALRADAMLQDIPVIIMSGGDPVKRAQEAYAHGAQDFLEKPLRFRPFLQKIQNILT